MSDSKNEQIRALIQRFQAIYNGHPWYGTNILSSLKQITPEMSLQSLLPEKKNIAEILKHIVAWRQFLIEHLQGNSSYRIELNSELDWPSIKDLSWDDLLEELGQSQAQILQLLAGQEDTLLESTLSNVGSPYTFRYLIEGILQHDAYHLGQINLLGSYFLAQAK